MNQLSSSLHTLNKRQLLFSLRKLKPDQTFPVLSQLELLLMYSKSHVYINNDHYAMALVLCPRDKRVLVLDLSFRVFAVLFPLSLCLQVSTRGQSWALCGPAHLRLIKPSAGGRGAGCQSISAWLFTSVVTVALASFPHVL